MMKRCLKAVSNFRLILSIVLNALDFNKANSEVRTDSVRIVVLGSSTALGFGPFNYQNAWVYRFTKYVVKDNEQLYS
jgi:hypothetical protein